MKLLLVFILSLMIFSPNTTFARKFYDEDIEELSDELGRLRKRVSTLEERIEELEKGNSKDKVAMQMCVITSSGKGKKNYTGRARTVLEAQTQARDKCQKVEVAAQCDAEPKCEAYSE